MKLVVITYSPAGADLGKRAAAKLGESFDCQCYLFDRYKAEGWMPFHETEIILQKAFEENSAVLFICAVGIAVRMTAPFIVSKYTDSPVVVMDDMGKFAISLLGGHVGGANELAKCVAGSVGAVSVITTSTDLHEKFAVDMFAKNNELYCEDKTMAKMISAAVLNHERVGLSYDEKWCGAGGKIPRELCVMALEKQDSQYGIVITPFVRETVFVNTLTLVPKQITLGIGCRKNVPVEEVEHAVFKVLHEHHILLHGIKQVCSIDLKKEEEGIRQFCQKYQLPFVTFSAEELETVEGSVSHSEFVETVTGVDNVCERSALRGSVGELIVSKQIEGRVTLAAAIEKICLRFDL